MEIPNEVVTAINLLLAPYGQTFKMPKETGAESDEETLLDYKEACKYLRVSHGTLRRRVLAGDIECLQIGANNCKRLFRKSELNRALKRG